MMQPQAPQTAPQGIRQLMPGQAMPGQAPMPVMAPQQGPTQQAPQIGPVLAMFDDWQLKSMLDRPEVAGMALAELNRRNQQTRMRMMGMQAQGQMQQNPGTVKDQVLAQSQPVQQPPVMAARGGLMRGYNEGGIVALQSGGTTSYPVKDQPEVEETSEWWRRLPPDSLLRKILEDRAARGQARSRARFPSMYKPSAEERPAPEEAGIDENELKRLMSLPSGVERYGPMPSQVVPPAPAPSAPKPTVPAPSAAPAAARPTPPAPLSGIAQLTKEQRDQLAAQKEAELKAANAALPEQEALKAARAAQAKAQSDELGMYERLMGDLKEREASLLSPQALLQMAGGISTKRGELMGSLARGASGYMKSVDEYNQRIADKRRDLMQLQATRRSAIEERNVAMAEGDVTRARAAQDKITQIDQYYSNLQRSLEKDQFEREMESKKVAATQEQARAATTTAQAAKTRAEQSEKPEGLTRYQEAQLRNTASDNVRNDKTLPSKIMRARQEATKLNVPFDENAYINTLVEQELARLLGKTPPTPAAGAPTRVIDFGSIK